MRYRLLFLLLSGCMCDSRNVTIRNVTNSSEILTCALATGGTIDTGQKYTGCSDGKEHGYGTTDDNWVRVYDGK